MKWHDWGITDFIYESEIFVSLIKELAMHVCTQTEPIGMKSRSYRVGIQLLSDQDGSLNQSLHHSFGESVQQSLLSSHPSNGMESYSK